MPEITIKYTSPKTLKALKALSSYFDFVISTPKHGTGNNKKKDQDKNTFIVNGVTVLRGDSSIDISAMSDVFTGKNIDAKQLRASAWNRNK